MEKPSGNRVLLLKGERSEGGGGGSDAYRDLLESEGFQVNLVPVLQFSHVNASLVVPMLNSRKTFSIVQSIFLCVHALFQKQGITERNYIVQLQGCDG